MTEPYFITAGDIADHGFDTALVGGAFPDWTFSGSGSFLRDTDDKPHPLTPSPHAERGNHL